MNKLRLSILLQAAIVQIATLLACTSALAQMQLVSLHAPGMCFSNSSGIAITQACVGRSEQQMISTEVLGAPNDAQRGLKIAGQCLEARGQGQPLAFSSCKSHPSQDWRFVATTGQLHNAQGLCADSGNGQRWSNNSSSQAQILALPGLKPVTAGTLLLIKDRHLLLADSMQVVATSLPSNLASLPQGTSIHAAGVGFVVTYRPGP
jgi:hypothetical protein